jgi:hypothetical protein
MTLHTVILAGEGDPFSFGDVGGRVEIGGDAMDERFVVVQLPEIPPRTRAARLHRYHNEDENPYVEKGSLGTLAGEEVITAEPGMWLSV